MTKAKVQPVRSAVAELSRSLYREREQTKQVVAPGLARGQQRGFLNS